MIENPLPVSIISGFLGSGKTTLLKRILASSKNANRIAVIENELGDIPIDDLILAEFAPARMDTVLGRTCCETRGTFIKTLREILKSRDSLDKLVIESTGVAHPGMLANAILGDPELSQKMKLDGIITIVDSANFISHLDGDGHAREQVAFADSIIINKCDIADETKIQQVENIIQEINPTANCVRTSYADTNLSNLLELGGFDIKKIAGKIGGCASICGGHHSHSHDITTLAIRTNEPYAFLSLKEWLEDYIAEHRDDIYRAKGVLWLANVDKQIVFQGVHDNFYLDVGEDWGENERVNSLIFIGVNLNENEIRAGLKKCVY